ncbi:MAG: TIGR02594 family protein, partial [Pseudolabrys sp.]|nr:TIGR02594 family protein [Pseudolabrys sp.]
MRFKNRMMIAIGSAALLTMSAPAISQPVPTPKPSVAERQQSNRAAKNKAIRHAARERRATRLVSRSISAPPKRPAFGWPALVKEARKYMGTNPTDRKRLWCATFMNMVLAKTGYAGTNSDAAKSFAQYGHRISKPKVGAIAVLTRGKRGGHVGVVSGIDANGNPIIISGNHGRKVGEAIYPRSRVIAYVMPSERRSGKVQASVPGTPDRAAPEGGIESPITELLAAIEAEQGRPERSRQNVARLPSPVPHITVQQAAEPPARRELQLEPGLAEFLGIKERAQVAPRSVPPQREQRVEHRHSGRV